MASERVGGQQPIGSSDWIFKEYKEISALCENELEDFTFSARNEVEWLNEHMSDIFSSNRLQLADLLKTPGKLRGKTPRTARQRSPLKELRQPLGELPSASKRVNSPLRSRTPQSPTVTKTLAENDKSNIKSLIVKPVDRRGRDSGYHGDSQEEMEVELPETQDLESDEKRISTELLNEEERKNVERESQSQTCTGSSHSAREEEQIKEPGIYIANLKRQEGIQKDDKVSEQLRRESAPQDAPKPSVNLTEGQKSLTNDETDHETNDVESDQSTPAKTLVRKSSLNFASLPAREPLTTKKSMGNVRISSQTSYFGRITGGKSLGAGYAMDFNEDEGEDGNRNIEQVRTQMVTLKDSSDEVDAPNTLTHKSSTQRLADRINALGKVPLPRQTKSVAAIAPQSSHSSSEDSQSSKNGHSAQNPAEEDDEPWLEDEHEVLSSPNYQVYPSSDAEDNQDIAVPQSPVKIPTPAPESEPVSTKLYETNTPADSPPKNDTNATGHVQASKSRLQSLMQSARGLFSSSAVASAEAKLEASSVPSPKREQNNRTLHSVDWTTKQSNDAPLLPDLNNVPNSQYLTGEERVGNAEILSGQMVLSQEESKDAADTQGELQNKATGNMGPPPRPRSALSKPGSTRRPINKPTKEQPTQQKLSIKMGSLAGRRPLTAASLSAVAKEHEPVAASLPIPAGKESLTSVANTCSSASSNKSATISKARNLSAAEKKREAEERAAVKRAEQKRELEKRRIAQQEEAQKREQAKQEAERQKERQRLATEEKRRQEQRQAVEKKRADAQAKREQMQKEQQQPSHQSTQHRADPPRPASRQAMVGEFPRPPTSNSNNAKLAPKRAFNADREENLGRSIHSQTNQGYQQQNGKRRKTEDEDELQTTNIRSAMPPPIRMSNIKNGLKSSLFEASSYPRAPPPAAHHVSNSQQGFVQAQSIQQLPRPPTALDNARFQNGAIPFANGNVHNQHPPTASSSQFKTPMQPGRLGQPSQQAYHQQQQQLKSSPFVNGDHLHLDEIPTDSEDEDSETEKDRKANLPDWVRTPNLNETLMQQETINPDAVFGPIAPLNMEEMFKGRGQKKDFRSRTSSANWVGSDRLTEEEIKRDMEAREKMRRDGGWSFSLS